MKKSVQTKSPNTITFPTTAKTARILKKAEAAGINRSLIINACLKTKFQADAEKALAIDAKHAQKDLFLLARCIRDSLPQACESIEVNISHPMARRIEALAGRLARLTDQSRDYGVDYIVNQALESYFRED